MREENDKLKLAMIPSKSRYEIECERLGSERAVRDFFRSEEVFQKIYESHQVQKENLRTLEAAIGRSVFYDRSALSSIADRYDAFVICGGDNHFTYCAQQILKGHHNAYVAGLVLDDVHSAGALLSYDTRSFLDSFDALREGTFESEQWTTLEGKLDGGPSLAPAIGDYLIGEHARQEMSRNHVWIDGEKALPEKSSGILIATGAGSQPGSWFNSLYSIYTDEDATFPCTERKSMLMATENPEKPVAYLEPGQTVTIDSYNDTYGEIVPDSHGEHATSFLMGQRAHIRISDSYMNVIRGERG